MKPGKYFNQQQKRAVLASAKTIEIKEAAVLAEVHYSIRLIKYTSPAGSTPTAQS
jgi:hypothetical protein